MQLKFKSKLKNIIPDTIIIGLFMVNIKMLKTSLIEKRDNLANSLMRYHANKTSEQLESYCAEYKRIYLKLSESPVSIEQVFEIREWINTLPNIIQNKSEIVKNVILVFRIIYIFTCSYRFKPYTQNLVSFMEQTLFRRNTYKMHIQCMLHFKYYIKLY